MIANGDYNLLYFKLIKGKRLISDNKCYGKNKISEGWRQWSWEQGAGSYLKEMYSEDLSVLRKYV